MFCVVLPQVGYCHNDTPGGPHVSYAGRDNGKRGGRAGYAGKETGELQLSADIPDNHRGQWQRVPRLGGHDADRDRRRGPDAYLLLSSVQCLRTREQRERKPHDSAAGAEGDGLHRDNRGGHTGSTEVGKRVPARHPWGKVCRAGAAGACPGGRY